MPQPRRIGGWNALPNELCYQILQPLLDRNLLRYDYRRVSKDFCRVITPLLFSRMTITARMFEYITPFASTAKLKRAVFGPDYQVRAAAAVMLHILKCTTYLTCQADVLTQEMPLASPLLSLKFESLKHVT